MCVAPWERGLVELLDQHPDIDRRAAAEMTPRIPPPSMASATRRPSRYGRLPARARAASTRSTSCAGATLGGATL